MQCQANVIRRALIFTVCMLSLTGAGCKNKITKDNFDKIENGMSLQEVERILGPGTPVGGDGSGVAAQVGVDVGGGLGGRPSPLTEYTWESGGNSITVGIMRDKVVAKRKSGI